MTSAVEGWCSDWAPATRKASTSHLGSRPSSALAASRRRCRSPGGCSTMGRLTSTARTIDSAACASCRAFEGREGRRSSSARSTPVLECAGWWRSTPTSGTGGWATRTPGPSRLRCSSGSSTTRAASTVEIRIRWSPRRPSGARCQGRVTRRGRTRHRWPARHARWRKRCADTPVLGSPRSRLPSRWAAPKGCEPSRL